MADLIYSRLPTCDQLQFYLLDEGAAAKVCQLVDDKAFASLIFGMGMNAEENEVAIGENLRVRVIRKPAIIGAEDEFPQVILEGWLEDNASGVRLPGFSFMRGGRAIGIHGPPPDYRRIWNRKRSRSKHQSQAGHGFVTFISDDDVLGSPADHKRFFEHVWLTESNPEVSGLALLGFAQDPNGEEVARFEYFPNPHARHTVRFDYFETMDSTDTA